ncbi:Aste57867_5125 [Aphanomyces stellatus]|uniref:Aste57867_5125 protein n=1 Tax=Aphanomyces stellatus TaxID=120398 RepID=A0A485KE86_9STRA|nr:hypothetical protein As57867_005112 [Aphanomyces stellatus]VFT82205.1 Aste57867_5125 [Aphanomyces stellatus]
MPRRGAGPRLTEAERLAILTELGAPQPRSYRSIAKAYGVSDTAIRKLVAKKLAVLQRTSCVPRSRLEKPRRYSTTTLQSLELTLHEWIVRLRTLKIQLPPCLVQTKAQSIAASLVPPILDFHASPGWLANFRRRYDVGSTMLHGEGAEVDKNDPSLLHGLRILSNVIATYPPSRVYNMDESGLFYRLLPRYTLLASDETPETTRGRKEAKDRVSIVFCANSDGTHKLPMTMIGKAKHPTCSTNAEWPLVYYSQQKAWVDRTIFLQWFKEVFVPRVRDVTNEPVLLFMDNAPGHFTEYTVDGVRVAFLPPNCTSWRQPMDLGIIAATKKRYRFLLLQQVVSFLDKTDDERTDLASAAASMRAGAAGLMFGKRATVMDAARLLKEAWDAVSCSTIANAFKKADMRASYRDAVAEADEPEECSVESVDNVDFTELIDSVDGLTIENLGTYLACDDRDSSFYLSSLLEDMEL